MGLEREYDFVFEMDCDFSHDPKAIPSLLEKAGSMIWSSEVAISMEFELSTGLSRDFFSYLAGIYIRIVTGIPIIDSTGGFKCFTRRALESINIKKIFSTGYIFQLELNYKVYSKVPFRRRSPNHFS